MPLPESSPSVTLSRTQPEAAAHRVPAPHRAGPQGMWAEGRLGGSGLSSGGPASLSPIRVHATGGQPVFLLSRPRSSGPSRPVSPRKGQSLGLPCQAALSAGWGRTLLSAACPVPRVLVPRPLISLSDSCSLAPLNPHCLWPKAGAPNVRRLVSLQGRRDRAREARLSSPVQWGRRPPAVTSASVQRSAQGAAAWQHMRVRSLTSVPGTNAKLRG